MERVEVGTVRAAFLRIGGRDIDHGVIRPFVVAFAQAAVVIGGALLPRAKFASERYNVILP
jgi:hypothetical protein